MSSPSQDKYKYLLHFLINWTCEDQDSLIWKSNPSRSLEVSFGCNTFSSSSPTNIFLLPQHFCLLLILIHSSLYYFFNADWQQVIDSRVKTESLVVIFTCFWFLFRHQQQLVSFSQINTRICCQWTKRKCLLCFFILCLETNFSLRWLFIFDSSWTRIRRRRRKSKNILW